MHSYRTARAALASGRVLAARVLSEAHRSSAAAVERIGRWLADTEGGLGVFKLQPCDEHSSEITFTR